MPHMQLKLNRLASTSI